MENWPSISSTESVGTEKTPRFHCVSETRMPCGYPLSVKQNGYNKNNVKRRAEAAVSANARRHLRSCNKCSMD